MKYVPMVHYFPSISLQNVFRESLASIDLFWEIFRTDFLSCISGVDFKDIEYEELAAAIREVCKEQNIVVIEGQVSFTTIWPVQSTAF